MDDVEKPLPQGKPDTSALAGPPPVRHKSAYGHRHYALQLNACPPVTCRSMRHILNEPQDKRPFTEPPLQTPLPALSLTQSNLFHRQAFLFSFLFPWAEP